MGIEEVVIQIFQSHVPLLAFVAGLLLGDVLIFLAMLSGVGKIHFGVILVFGLMGDITHDLLLYFFSNSKLAYFIKKKIKLSKKKNVIVQFIEKINIRKSYFVPLVISKFFYGIRDAVILYVSHGERDIKRYLLTISMAGFIWILTITGAGWLAGRGFSGLLSFFKGFEKIVLVLVIGAIIFLVIGKTIFNLLFKFIKKII